MNIKILHLSDLHIGLVGKDEPPLSQNFYFHQILLEYLITEFGAGKIDYLIISGDLADKCMVNDNMLAATMWLQQLIDGLGIESKRVIVCCGNHDIETEFFKAAHDTNRLKYEKGRFYIMAEYADKSYENYNTLLKSAKIDHTQSKVEFDDIRFFTVNSSWLSQNNKKLVRIQSEEALSNLAKSRDATLESLHSRYGAVFTGSKSEKKIIATTLNFSENTRQQLALFSKYPTFPPFKDYDDDKLTLIVFHHPEDYLHEFEKYGIVGLEGSGQYGLLATNGNALVCGHIHPRNRIDGENVESHIKMLIGGGAHLDPDDEERKGVFLSERKPIFYHYGITNGSGDHKCEKELFFWNNTKRTIERDILESRAVVLSKKSDRQEIIIREDAQNKLSEEKLMQSKEELRRRLLMSCKEAVEKGIKTTLEPNHYYWMDVTEKPSYRAFYKGAQLSTAEGGSILIDIFFVDEYFDNHVVKTRCAKNLYAASESSSLKYMPIFVDLLYASVAPDQKHKYKQIKKKQMGRLVKYLTGKVPDFDANRLFNLKRLLSEMGTELPANIDKLTHFNPFSGIVFFDTEHLVNYMSSPEPGSLPALDEVLQHVRS